MTTTYTAEQRRADQLAVTHALLPLVDPVLAEMGLTRAEGMALIAAGKPPPPRTFSTAPHSPRPDPASAPEEVPVQRKHQRAA